VVGPLAIRMRCEYSEPMDRETIAALVESLHDETYGTRSKPTDERPTTAEDAAHELGLRGAEAVQAVLPVLSSDAVFKVPAYADDWGGNIGEYATRDVFPATLACDVVRMNLPVAAEAVDAVARALTAGRHEVITARLTDLLITLAPASHATESVLFPALVTAASNPERATRYKFIEHLADFGTLAAPLLRENLTSKDIGIREAAARGLGQLGDESMVPTLIDMAQNDRSNVRAGAIWALGEIGGAAAVEALGEWLQREGRQGVYVAAALAQAGGESSHARAASRLLELTGHEDKHVAAFAQKRLNALG
jgi:hypothetical protein